MDNPTNSLLPELMKNPVKTDIYSLIADLQNSLLTQSVDGWIQHFDAANSQLIENQVQAINKIFVHTVEAAHFEIKSLECEHNFAVGIVSLMLSLRTFGGQKRGSSTFVVEFRQNREKWQIVEWVKETDWLPFKILFQEEYIEILPQKKRIQITTTLKIKRKAKNWSQCRLSQLFRLDWLNPSFQINQIKCSDRIFTLVPDEDTLISDMIRDDYSETSPRKIDVSVTYSGEPPKNKWTYFGPTHLVWYRLPDTTIIIPRQPFSIESTLKLRVFIPKRSCSENIVTDEWCLITRGEHIATYTTGSGTEFHWDVDSRTLWNTLLCAGRYESISRESNGLLTVCHLFAEDIKYVNSILRHIDRILNLYSKLFCPYPFKTLTVFEVGNWVKQSDGHAGNSFIILTQRCVKNHLVGVLAHELAHQWWHSLVHYSKNSHIYLAEGMAKYCSWLCVNWVRAGKLHRQLIRGELLMLMIRAAETSEHPLDTPTKEQVVTQTLKAAFLHHMLRRWVGDDFFFQIWQEHARKHGGLLQVSLVDFERLAEEVYGKPLGWFFEQWVHGTGMPHFHIEDVVVEPCKNSSGVWVVTGILKQVGKKIFRVQVDLVLETESGIEQYSISHRNQFHNFRLTTCSKPKYLCVDPENQLLRFHNCLGLLFGNPKGMQKSLWVYGTAGQATSNRRKAKQFLKLFQKIYKDLDVCFKSDRQVTSEDLISNHLFLFGYPSTHQIALKLEEHFPIRFKGTTFKWKGKLYNKPTQSVIQLIENPSVPQYYICLLSFGLEFNPTIVQEAMLSSYHIFDGETLVEHGVAEEEMWLI